MVETVEREMKKLKWEWHVDQIIYITKGCVCVVMYDCKDEVWFYEGDLVKYPKWLEVALYFQGPYEERYCFLAYGDNFSLSGQQICALNPKPYALSHKTLNPQIHIS